MAQGLGGAEREVGDHLRKEEREKIISKVLLSLAYMLVHLGMVLLIL